VSLEIVPGRPEDRYQILRLSGRLDAAFAEEHKPRIDTLVGGGPSYLVSDLTGLKYISSAGINLLVGACRELRKRGGDLRLTCLQPGVKEILDLTGLTKIFSLYENVDAAIKDLI
jgi:anti-anti-sigma factor